MPHKHNPKLISVEFPTPLSTKMASLTSSNIQPLSPLIQSRPSTPSTHTITPTPEDFSFEWIFQDHHPYPFIMESSSTTDSQIRKLKAFDIEGVVIDFYLHADALSHTIQLQLPSSDINNIKNIIWTAPNHAKSEYRWPFDGCIAKFICKDSKEKLAADFEPILDECGINLKKFTGMLQDLTINDVV